MFAHCLSLSLFCLFFSLSLSLSVFVSIFISFSLSLSLSSSSTGERKEKADTLPHSLSALREEFGVSCIVPSAVTNQHFHLSWASVVSV